MVKTNQGGNTSFSKLIWERVRKLGKVPLFYKLFYLGAKVIFGDKVITIRNGPLSNYKWQHQTYYQPWMALGLYEPQTTAFIVDNLNSGDVFYDVGANAGYFTLVAAKAIGHTGMVIAFDPLPVNVVNVQKQIMLNKLENCKVESLAISDHSGLVNFTIQQKNANSHLEDIEAPHILNEQADETIQVKSITLDEYIFTLGNKPPTMIKIDIEGAEIKALQGASKMLSSQPAPIIIVTAHSPQIAEEVHYTLNKNGYSYEKIDSTFFAFPQMPNGVNND